MWSHLGRVNRLAPKHTVKLLAPLLAPHILLFSGVKILFDQPKLHTKIVRYEHLQSSWSPCQAT